MSNETTTLQSMNSKSSDKSFMMNLRTITHRWNDSGAPVDIPPDYNILSSKIIANVAITEHNHIHTVMYKCLHKIIVINEFIIKNPTLEQPFTKIWIKFAEHCDQHPCDNTLWNPSVIQKITSTRTKYNIYSFKLSITHIDSDVNVQIMCHCMTLSNNINNLDICKLTQLHVIRKHV